MNFNKPLVSAIVPVYNVREYIRECVESVLKQTYENVECICVDDGSIDGSAEILDELARVDARVVVVHQKNSGVSMARNKALGMARGSYITFLDSDDVLAPDFLANAMTAFSNDRQLDIWIGQVLKVDERNVEYSDSEQPSKPIPGTYCLPLREFLRMPGRQYLFALYPKVYNASIIRSAGINFREGMSNGEDSLFVTKVFSFAKKVLIDKRICYRRRMRRGSLVGGSWAAKVNDSLVAIIDLQDFALHSSSKDQVCNYVAQRALSRFSVILSNGYTSEFLCDYIKALFNHVMFRRAVCLPIMRWAPVCFRLPAAMIWLMPKAFSCLALCMIARIKVRILR